MPYSVMIEIDRGEWVYVPKENPFTTYSDPIMFDNKEDAEKEAANWNTGVVVERRGNLRTFDDTERMRSKVRALINKGL